MNQPNRFLSLASISRIVILRHLCCSRNHKGNIQREYFKRARAKRKREIYQSHNSHQQWNSTTDLVGKGNDDAPYKISSNCDTELLFGTHPVYAALQGNRRQFSHLYVRMSLYKELQNVHTSQVLSTIVKNIYQQVLSLSIPIIPADKRRLDKLSAYGVHQGLILSSSPIAVDHIHPITSNSKSSSAVWMLICNVVDPMNLGGLIRSAVYLGVDKVILSPNCSKLSPVVSKASSGAMEVAPLSYVTDTCELLLQLRNSGWNVLGTTSSDDSESVPLSSVTLNQSTVLIVGNEGKGIDENVTNCCTHLINISSHSTCPSHVDSLNVSVAGAIILNHLKSM